MSTTTSLKRAGPLLAAACAALMLIPAASPAGGPPYPDATGDSSSAGDINGVTVLADKPSGQIVFRISGANLSTSPTSVTLLFVDADANPATGSPSWLGADYVSRAATRVTTSSTTTAPTGSARRTRRST